MIGEYIERIETYDTGGNCPVDFIHLPDGRVIGVDDETVVLYQSMQDFEQFITTDRPTICLKGYEDDRL